MTTARGGAHTVRRLITYLLLFVAVTIAAIGISGLLSRLFETGRTIISSNNDGLAGSIAFAVIGGSLGALLWWLSWRKSMIEEDRNSWLWPIYLVLMITVALLTFTFALYSWCSELVRGAWSADLLGIAVAWGLVWIWHYWMWRHPANSPTRLIGVAPAISWLIGLLQAVGGAITILSSLIDSSITQLTGAYLAGDPWHQPLSSLPWLVGGTAIWLWHWYAAKVRVQDSAFSNILIVLASSLFGTALFVSGATLAVYVVLSLLITSDRGLMVNLDPVGMAIALTALGAVVVLFHQRVISKRSAQTQTASRLVITGVALIAFATGIGITINAGLAAISTPLTGYDNRSLLLGGLSALLVGGASWWFIWRRQVGHTDERATPIRRIYLIVIFGASALTALVTLLVIGYQLFVLLLEGRTFLSFIDGSRQAIGLLVAALLVSIYHFLIWRSGAASVEDAPKPRVREMTIVAGPAFDAAELKQATGAKVSLLPRQDELKDEHPSGDSVEKIAAAISELNTERVLVLMKDKGKFEIIPLGD